MPKVLLIHHTPSPGMQELLEAARAGLALVPDVQVVVRPALSATPSDLLAADGVLLGTPANIGYMSGALKVFFDGVYYPCLDATVGLPYALYVHGQNDTTGAVRSVETVTNALRWHAVAPPLTVVGNPTADDRAACTDLAGVLAATVSP